VCRGWSCRDWWCCREPGRGPAGPGTGSCAGLQVGPLPLQRELGAQGLLRLGPAWHLLLRSLPLRLPLRLHVHQLRLLRGQLQGRGLWGFPGAAPPTRCTGGGQGALGGARGESMTRSPASHWCLDGVPRGRRGPPQGASLLALAPWQRPGEAPVVRRRPPGGRGGLLGCPHELPLALELQELQAHQQGHQMHPGVPMGAVPGLGPESPPGVPPLNLPPPL